MDIKLEVRVKSAENLPILHGGVIFPSGRADVAGCLQPERILTTSESAHTSGLAVDRYETPTR